MHPKYPHVFSPIKLGPLEIGNRFYFAPHGINVAVGNEPANDFPYYSAERVRGGCQLVINSLNVYGKVPGLCSPYPDKNVRSFQAVADMVHAEGGKIIGQLWYFWCSPGQWRPMSPPRPSLAPSAMQLFGSPTGTHQMSRSELKAFVDVYRQAATNLRRAGYDGVEVHVSHGTLLEQMISPYFNQRTDEFGGSRSNRMRFVREILDTVREAIGDRMALGIRYNCDELLPGGYGEDAAAEILAEICSWGHLDFVDLDVAVEPQQLWLGMPSVFVEKFPYKRYVEKIRHAAGAIPILSVLGRLTSVEEAEAAIASGVCDMVGTARALIAEPNLVRNAREGKEEQSRTCISCNYCLQALYQGNGGCSINPTSYRERHWGEKATPKAPAEPAKTVVVGGGPAGLEAARVAAGNGHRVVLFEANDELGGGLRVWATLPGRGWFQQGVDWWRRELARLGVNVRLGVKATAETILAEEPAAVILATGSHYSTAGRSGFLNQDIPGHDQDFVHVPEDILTGGVRPRGKVVVLDGEGIHVGGGIAEILAEGGNADVELVTPGLTPVDTSIVLTREVSFVIGRLKAAGVRISTETYLRSIGDHSVTLYDVFTNEERVVSDVAAVVLATSRVANDALSAELEGRVKQLFPVGDALAPRLMAAATYEGHMFARFIGVPGAPTNFSEAYWPEPDAEEYPRPASVLLDAVSD